MFKSILKVAMLILAVLLVVAWFTNPEKEDFALRIKMELDKEVNSNNDNPALQYIAEIGLKFTKHVAEKMMVRKNYGICSIFVISLPDGDYSYLGAFGNYFPLQTKNPLDQINKHK